MSLVIKVQGCELAKTNGLIPVAQSVNLLYFSININIIANNLVKAIINILLIKHKLKGIFFSFQSQQYRMRKQGIYLMQLETKTIRYAILPEGQITMTLRIGRNSASSTFTNHNNAREVDVQKLIQLNIDSTALQAQRCSLTFNCNDQKKIVGIALISIPKDKNQIQNTYRLTQNEDKRAEVDLKIAISPFDPPTNRTPILELNSQNSNTDNYVKSSSTKSIDNNNPFPKIYINNMERIDSVSNYSNAINSTSKISDQLSNIYSEEKKSQISRTFKIREETRIVQVSENQLKRFKDEKEAYYQLYQIEKSKNQIACKFINNFVRKVTEMFPTIATSIVEAFEPKKSSIEQERKNAKNQSDSIIITQLEQANRSLHRQLDQYKKIVEQLKHSLTQKNGNHLQLSNKDKKNNNLLTFLFDDEERISRVGQRSVIRPANKPQINQQSKSSSDIKDIDFTKWIHLSIEQRGQLQQILRNVNQKYKDSPSQGNLHPIKKLKANIDKSFACLLSKKQLTRDALIIHRKEINRVFQQILQT